METTQNVLVLGSFERDDAVYLDCLREDFGRTRIRLRRESVRMEAQKKEWRPLSLVRLLVYDDLGKEPVAIRGSLMSDWGEGLTETFAGAFLQVITAVTQRRDVAPMYAVARAALEAAEEGDCHLAMVRFLYYVLAADRGGMSLERCAKCGHTFIPHSLFYFNTHYCRFECSRCVDGDSRRLLAPTYNMLKAVVATPFDRLATVKVSKSFLSYVLYLFTEAAISLFGALNALERFAAELPYDGESGV